MPTFLNVDFEFVSDYDLTVIADSYQHQLLILLSQQLDNAYHLSFELLSQDSVNVLLAEFFDWLATLPDEHQALLLNSRQKVIDIGFESGEGDRWVTKISPPLLQKIADGGFELLITIYPIAH